MPNKCILAIEEEGRVRRVTTGRLAAAAVVALLGAACSGPSVGDDTLTVFATTGYIADAVRAIAPAAAVVTMVGPGGDPHTYQPSTRDFERMRSADLVLWHGLHLEAQFEDQLSSLPNPNRAVAETLRHDDLIPLASQGGSQAGLYDPHVWNDPMLWVVVVEHIAQAIAEVDPDRSSHYHDNSDAFIGHIEDAHEYAQTAFSTVPPPRLVVTGHDAFGYLGRAYHVEIRATDFMSTDAQLSASGLSDLADTIAQLRVPAIFQDSQANPQAIESVAEAVRARGWDVQVTEAELFADALGASPEVDTYLEVFHHNVDAIVLGLGGRLP